MKSVSINSHTNNYTFFLKMYREQKCDILVNYKAGVTSNENQGYDLVLIFQFLINWLKDTMIVQICQALCQEPGSYPL